MLVLSVILSSPTNTLLGTQGGPDGLFTRRVAITTAKPTNKGALIVAIVFFLSDHWRTRTLLPSNIFRKESSMTLCAIMTSAFAIKKRFRKLLSWGQPRRGGRTPGQNWTEPTAALAAPRRSCPEGHGDVPGLRSYLGSRAVRPNLIARDISRLILVQVSLPMIAS